MNFIKSILVPSALVLAFGAIACESHHESGVTSSYHSQWTVVAANTKDTTSAAQSVLNDEGLKNVTAVSTEVDGKASGAKADGTVVAVAVQKKDAGSEVSVTVGTIGDPTLGAEIAKKIKMKAEGH